MFDGVTEHKNGDVCLTFAGPPALEITLSREARQAVVDAVEQYPERARVGGVYVERSRYGDLHLTTSADWSLTIERGDLDEFLGAVRPRESREGTE